VRLTVATPLAIVIEVSDVAHLRAEDDTGAFGILPGHADFLTALAVSVASWRDDRGVEHHVAVRGGMLEVRDEEQAARTDAQRLYLTAIRQIARYLRAEKAPTMPAAPMVGPGDGFAP